MPREAFAVSLQRHLPRPGLPQQLFQLRPQAGHLRPTAPPRARRSPLDPITPHEGNLRLAVPSQIPESRDVGARRPAAVHVLVFEARHGAARAGLGDVVHQVVADLAARVGEAGRETRGLRVQEDLGGAEGRGAQKDQPPGVLARLLRIPVDHVHAYRAVLPLVVDHAVDNRVGDDGQVAGFPRRRQRRAQAREVAAVAAAAGALVPRLAAPAAVVRLGQIRDPRDRHVAPGERALDPPPHDVLGAVHLPRREEVTVRQVREA